MSVVDPSVIHALPSFGDASPQSETPPAARTQVVGDDQRPDANGAAA